MRLQRLTSWLKRRTQLVGLLIGLAVAAFLILLLAADVPFLAVWQRSLSDLLFLEQEPASRIVIVGVDDKSLAALGRWPWSRDIHAQLIDKLSDAGAQAIGLDLAFLEPGPEAADATLAASVAASKRTILPVIFDLASTQTDPDYCEAVGAQMPIPELMNGAAGLGSVNVVPDGDGIVRTVPLTIESDGISYETLSLVALGIAEPAFRRAEEQSSGTLDYGIRQIPLELGGRMRVNFVGPRGSFQTYSYADVLSGAVDPTAFEDRIVLIGITGLALGDYYMTPGSEGSPLPGVEIHANVLDTVLRGNFLVPQSPAMTALVILALALLGGLLFSRFKPLISGVIGIGLVFATIGVALVRFQAGVIDNIVYPPLAIMITFTGVVTYRVVFEGAEKRRVQSLFGRYLKPEIVDEIVRTADEDIVKLQGTEQELTVLFADIRGFTAMSENLTPPEVVAMLNHYLDFMTKVIFKHDGTLDKYIGDCIMAFWNAPHEQEDHALKAVEAALEMQCEMETALASAPTCDVPPVSFGIGVNTGPAVVGNMGSELRHDYTVIGDAVNFSSRLCGAAEPGYVIISPATYELVKDDVIVEELPARKFKGKAEESVIYNVIGLKKDYEQEPESAG